MHVVGVTLGIGTRLELLEKRKNETVTLCIRTMKASMTHCVQRVKVSVMLYIRKEKASV